MQRNAAEEKRGSKLKNSAWRAEAAARAIEYGGYLLSSKDRMAVFILRLAVDAGLLELTGEEEHRGALLLSLISPETISGVIMDSNR